MRHKNFIPVLLTIVLFACVAVSCERDPKFVKGQYKYEDHELNYINGLLIQWGNENVSDDIKDAVRDIVKSMVLVKSGTFTMGSNNNLSSDERPIHNVSLSDFYLAKVTVTQKQ